MSRVARTACVVAALLVVFWGAYAAVKPTNFGGVDEWLIVHLASRGIVSFPYANRPLSLLWGLPAQWLAPASFSGYRWLAGAYVSLTGLLVFWLCRRLAPKDTLVAVLAGAFTMVWAPADLLRLSTIQGTIHLGFACGAVLAVTLFVESWHRRSPVLLALAAAAALVTMLSYEAVLPLLVPAPLLLPWRRRESRSWVATWSAAMVLGAALALAPRVGASHEYQAILGVDPQPFRVGARLLKQYWLHLGPLVSAFPPPAATAVIPTIAVMAAALMAASDPEEPTVLRRLAVVGLIAAGLAYAPYALTSGVQGAMRTEILSAPGIALLLASALALGSARPGLPRRWIMTLAAAWVVFLGASSMSAMQQVWDRYGKFRAQRDSLVQLVTEVPDVRPHTLIVLVGETRDAWPQAFSFRHAVSTLYEDRAAGTIATVQDGPYRIRFGPEGIAVTPWPEIQQPWREPATVYGYHETIVAAMTASGRLGVLRDWPTGALPALPALAGYEPSSRIVRDGRTVDARGLLR